MKFRKKPVVIEAIQFTGKNHVAIFDFLGDQDYEHDADLIDIKTLEGDMRASVGDWIIKGVKGEFYPCKPDIFEATYEPVSNSTPTRGGGDLMYYTATTKEDPTTLVAVGIALRDEDIARLKKGERLEIEAERIAKRYPGWTVGVGVTCMDVEPTSEAVES